MKTTNGIVIKQRSSGDNDKFIDILTPEEGVIELCVKGAKKINSKNSSSTQLFAYSKFCINEKNGRNILNSAEPVHIFYNLRDRLDKLALASYFADLIKFCMREQIQSKEVMRLFLNTLHFAENNLRDMDFLKSVFELRLMAEIGFMPDVVACSRCGDFEPSEIYFKIIEGNFFCCKCADSEDSDTLKAKGTLSFLHAVRHIVLSDFERLYNFKISENTQSVLSYFSEQYILSHLERNFSTLEFYKSIK